MEVLSHNIQTLNPNAPVFIPTAYKIIEDFSEEWWNLVHSSPWFQDYWLQNCFQDPQFTPQLSVNDTFTLSDHSSKEEEKQEKDRNKDLVTLGGLKWRNMRLFAETPRFAEKAPKIVNKKVNPRPIQQPR